MTKQEKLTKLIEISKKNGYRAEGIKDTDPIITMLFNQDFAKAIWYQRRKVHIPTQKEREFGKITLTDKDLDWWQYHLQKAVLSKDPLEYYWENK